jgi:hypothetical protein
MFEEHSVAGAGVPSVVDVDLMASSSMSRTRMKMVRSFFVRHGKAL